MKSDDALLRHFLAALAYRTQKALRGAPPEFADFSIGHGTRTPRELVRHMSSVLGYARTFLIGGVYAAEPLETMQDEVERLHGVLADVAAHLRAGTPLRDITPEQLLQGPFADAMTHAGQLAMLRRMSGSPVESENFIYADISVDRLGTMQPMPVAPTPAWMDAVVRRLYRLASWYAKRP